MDCNWIPQPQESINSESVDSPPPTPPKMSESATTVPKNFDPNAPTLPPKPAHNHIVCVIHPLLLYLAFNNWSYIKFIYYINTVVML